MNKFNVFKQDLSELYSDKVTINPYDQIPLSRRLIDKKNSKVGIFDLGNHILIAGVILLVIFVSLNVE